jgi:HEAT repeat protein
MLNLTTGSICGNPILREITESEKLQLLGMLKHRNSRYRWIAANEIGELKISEGVDPLIATLKDNQWLVRLHAAKALGKIGDEKASLPLLACIYDSSPYVQRQVIVALGKLKEESAIPLMLEILLYDRKMYWCVNQALYNFVDNYAHFSLLKAVCEGKKTWKSNSNTFLSNLLTSCLLFLIQLPVTFLGTNIKAILLKAIGDFGNEKAFIVLKNFSLSKNKMIRLNAYQAYGKIECRKYEKYLPKNYKDSFKINHS